MGSGAARELEAKVSSDRSMDPELSARLRSALEKLDKMDPDFKAGRDDERTQQLTKAWKGKCKEIDGMLRELGHVLINTHQVALDVGSDGGGRDTRPFFEDLAGKFPKLDFRLQGDKVVAVCNNRGICLLYTSPSPRDLSTSRMPSSA